MTTVSGAFSGSNTHSMETRIAENLQQEWREGSTAVDGIPNKALKLFFGLRPHLFTKLFRDVLG